MKYLPLIWAGLWRKPLRTTLTTLALVVTFVLFGLLQGIDEGFGLLLKSSRMDRLFVGSRFGPPLPLAYKNQIAQMPGVNRVMAQVGMGGLINGDPKRNFFVLAADDGYLDHFSEFVVTQAQKDELRNKRNGFIVGKVNNEQWGFKVGDRVMMRSMPKRDGTSDWEFELIAIVDREDMPMFAGLSVGNFDYVNEDRANGKDMVNQFLVEMGDPSLAVSTAKAIDAMYANSGVPTRTQVEYINREQGMAGANIITMVHTIVLSSLFALLILTSNSIMQSFRERIPEIGTLKAIGYSDRQILGIVLAEALVQCVGGAVVGLFLARLLVPFAKSNVGGAGTTMMTVSWSLMALGILVALLVALMSAALPAWRAGRMQIVTALAAK